MIRHILWDIDGTLINFDMAETRALVDGFQAFGLAKLDQNSIDIYKRINQKYWLQLEKQEITKLQVLHGRFEEFFRYLNIDTSIVAEFNTYFQHSLSSRSDFNPYAREIVDYLDQNYIQYAVTNGTKIAQEGKLKKTGLDQVFKEVFISENIGYDKPSIKFFEEVFDKVGDDQLDLYIIIGDSLTSDIKGANNAGIKSVWYNPHKTRTNGELKIDYEIASLDQLKNIL